MLSVLVPVLSQPEGTSDTSARQVARGRDIQGIPWDRLQWTRDKYRALRLQQYKNYQNLSVPMEQLDKVIGGHGVGVVQGESVAWRCHWATQRGSAGVNLLQ